ncbi:MAG: hypothetical protein A2Y34_01205 [Spirochaetes bacterium GWC1_27_15]|nr:MAG: hypothetical protein A2Z98_18415 [Spirochaetes bacterium GWB1_27_13]OHD21455.1 MAG: hypothetical protein A2Y34_01205 [Spirochaetes bacterium GWC1_27_15]
MVSISELKSITYIKDADEKDLMYISKYMEKIHLKNNYLIYGENDPAEFIYFILKGSVCLNIQIEENKYYLLCNLYEGDIFGIGEIFYDNYYTNSFTTSDCILLRMSKKSFFNNLLEIKFFNNLIMKDLANIVKINMVGKKYHNGINKILLALNYYCKISKNNADSYILNKNITIESIAKSINLTREYVSRVFSELKEKNILRKEHSQIIINKKEFHSYFLYEDICDKMKF